MSEHMQPQTEYGLFAHIEMDHKGTLIVPFEYMYDVLREQLNNEGDRCEIELYEGWYARMSAPGYLDCTDWQGPYIDQQKAIADLCDIYDVPPSEHEDWQVEYVDGEGWIVLGPDNNGMVVPVDSGYSTRQEAIDAMEEWKDNT